MALNTDYAIRTGAFEPEKGSSISEDADEMKKIALERYNTAKVSCIQNKNNCLFLPQEAQSRILWGLALTEVIYAVLFS